MQLIIAHVTNFSNSGICWAIILASKNLNFCNYKFLHWNIFVHTWMNRVSQCNGMYDRLVNSSQLKHRSSKRENSFGQCQRDFTYSRKNPNLSTYTCTFDEPFSSYKSIFLVRLFFYGYSFQWFSFYFYFYFYFCNKSFSFIF